MSFKDLKLIFTSLLIVAPFFVAIVLIKHFTDKYDVLQGEYAGLWYILPIMAALVVFLVVKTRD